eukprot:2490913-Amphidinium_carterae.1
MTVLRHRTRNFKVLIQSSVTMIILFLVFTQLGKYFRTASIQIESPERTWLPIEVLLLYRQGVGLLATYSGRLVGRGGDVEGECRPTCNPVSGYFGTCFQTDESALD